MISSSISLLLKSSIAASRCCNSIVVVIVIPRVCRHRGADAQERLETCQINTLPRLVHTMHRDLQVLASLAASQAQVGPARGKPRAVAPIRETLLSCAD